MGSLITALASYCDIKQAGGQWLVRIDDLDPPRQDPNAVASIIRSLTVHGLQSDRPIEFQSNHATHYDAALKKLQPHLFYCRCSRRQLRGLGRYPGTCRNQKTFVENSAVRINMQDGEQSFDDGFLGPLNIDLATQLGDFIVRRRDGLIAYNLATAVDDGRGITHVLRGQDLLPVTAPQRYLMTLLNLPLPEYAHIPCLEFEDGSKLSKQTHAPALKDETAAQNLVDALWYLGFSVPEDTKSVPLILNWALEHFNPAAIPKRLPKYRSSRV